MYKNNSKKIVSKNNRVYFISTNGDEDLNKLKDYFADKYLFIDKIYQSESASNMFINIKLNTVLEEGIFYKFADKLNRTLYKQYKIFYIDVDNNKFVYTPKEILTNINDSLYKFIED